VTTAAAPLVASHPAEAMRRTLPRELEGTRMAHLRPPEERPASIKEAIIRWFNQEL
jgi:hypothetical protein